MNTMIKVVNADQGHLNGQEFSAERIEENGYVVFKVTSTVEPLFLKEEEIQVIH